MFAITEDGLCHGTSYGEDDDLQGGAKVAKETFCGLGFVSTHEEMPEGAFFCPACNSQVDRRAGKAARLGSAKTKKARGKPVHKPVHKPLPGQMEIP